MKKKYRWIPFLALVIWLSLFLFAAEKITDGGFENWTGGNLDSWSKNEQGSSTVEQEETIVSAGSSSVQVNVDSGSTVLVYQAVTLVASNPYTVSAMVYGNASGTVHLKIKNSGNNVSLKSDGTWQADSNAHWYSAATPAEWTSTGSLNFNAHASYTAYYVLIENDSGTYTFYVDEYSLVDQAASSYIPKVIIITEEEQRDR